MHPLILASVGFICIQLSFLGNGVAALDALGALCLIISFCLFIFHLFKEARRDLLQFLCFLILITCIIIACWIKSQTLVAKIDDGYHTAKIVAYSLSNSITSKLAYIYPHQIQDSRLYYIDFIESVWGIFWRYGHHDLIIVILQSFLVLVVWFSLTQFFKCARTVYPSAVALAVVLNMQIFWSQQGSGFIDGTSGAFCAMALVGTYILIKEKDSSFEFVLATALSSVLCLLSKLTLIPVVFLGVIVCVRSLRHISRSHQMWVMSIIGIGFAYALYHYSLVCFIKGSPLYPAYPAAIEKTGAGGWYHYLYDYHPIHMWLEHHHIHWRFAHVLVSWLFDYKYRAWVTPDPWVAGNGILWTYCFVPFFIYIIVQTLRRRACKNALQNPASSILAVIAIYWLFLDISFNNRFMLGMHTFLLALALQWLLRQRPTWAKYVTTGLVILSMGSYICAVRNAFVYPKEVSVLESQFKFYPHYYPTEDQIPSTKL